MTTRARTVNVKDTAFGQDMLEVLAERQLERIGYQELDIAHSNYLDICNCPECSYFDMGKAHCCGLPERITARDVPRIKETIQSCLCANPTLWQHYERLEMEP